MTPALMLIKRSDLELERSIGSNKKWKQIHVT